MKKRLPAALIVWAAIFLCMTSSHARDYTLGDLYKQALINSEKIKYAEENLFIAKTGKEKAWALLLPRITAYGSYNRFTEQKLSPAGIVIQPKESSSWGVRIDETFSMSARELSALKIAGQSITKSEFDLDTTKVDFFLAVTSAYFDTLKARKGLEIASANVERITQYRDAVEKRVKVGELTRTTLLRAEGELSSARAEFVKATNALHLTRAALVRITGIEDNFRLKETKLPEIDELQLEGMRAMAFDARADVKSVDMQVKIAEEQVKFARGAFWPNIGLFAIYNGADQNSPGPTLNRESILAGVSLSFPFFEGGLRMAELKEAKAKERQARLAMDDFRKSVDIEMKSAYLELKTQKSILKFLEDQLIFAQDNNFAVLRQFENGLATSLDVMDANSLLLSAERNVTEAMYNFQFASLKVKKSMGTLLQLAEMKK